MAELTEVEASEIIQGAVTELASQQLLRIGLAAAAGGLVVGLAGGYFLGERRTRLRLERIQTAEIEEIKEHYREKQAELANQPKLDPEVMVRGLGYGSTAPDEPPVADEEIKDHVPESATRPESVFEQEPTVDVGPRAWDFHIELAKRDPTVPYVIHHTEFEETPDEHTVLNLTWYAGDDVLADERDIPVDDADELVGLGNLDDDMFGYGSDDPHIVFVRNERRRIDAEIAKSDGSFATEVGGQPPEEDDEYRARRRERERDER